ncbi:probable serine/threonine-protein kinase kinX [Ceratitis capitata]|uniref:probable serine/threonine-protein kinase kinX n=1 Tax=Ceratitis capitata TaxID=7213 RepID=UPI00032973CA|nr:probable serine/threonine-protein kinase kinX [Ceratitis capitata]
MKLLVIFAAALLGVQAVRVPYIVTDENGEKYQILLPQGGQGQGQGQQQQPSYVNVANQPAYDFNPQNYQLYLPPNQQAVVNYPRGVELVRQPVARGLGELYLPLGVSKEIAPDYEDSDEDYKWRPVYRKAQSAQREDSAKESDSDSSEEDEDKRKRKKQKVQKRKDSGSNEEDDSNDDDVDDEEEEDKNVDVYNLILPNNIPQQVHIPGLGVVNRPAVKKVKVEVPHYADAFLRQQIIEQFLAAQGLNPQAFDVQALIAQKARVQNPYNTGWDLQYSDNQQAVETRKYRRPINLQQLMYVTVPERKRRAAPAVSSTETTLESTTTNTLDITTVPDVTETSTILETTTMTASPEEVTVTTEPTQATTAQPLVAVITSHPILEIELEPEPEPFIPLFGYGSILPAEVSRVPFVPRIAVDTEVTSTSAPVEDVKPLFAIHSRHARAVPFDIKDSTKLKQATPVPPVPKTDVRGPKMSALPKSRSLRAVDVDIVTPPPVVTETDAAVAPKVVQSTTTVNCDIECTKFDLNPVCAFNGECYHEFPNQCAMDTFVCQRPELGFTSTPRERCVMHWLTRCTSQDFKNE